VHMPDSDLPDSFNRSLHFMRVQIADNASLEIDGVIKPLSKWALESGLDIQTIRQRLRKDWDPKVAVTLPSKSKLCAKCGERPRAYLNSRAASGRSPSRYCGECLPDRPQKTGRLATQITEYPW
jgi:hypothetical protein